jgi:hypothetical protein
MTIFLMADEKKIVDPVLFGFYEAMENPTQRRCA